MASRTTAAAVKKTAATPAKKVAKGGPVKTPVRGDEWKTNIVEAKVNGAVLAEELRKRHLETRGATMVLAARLERTICTSAAGATIVACDDCHGRSVATDPRCPYCGSTEEVVTNEKSAAPSAAPVAAPVAPKALEPDAVEEEPEGATAEAAEAEVVELADDDVAEFPPALGGPPSSSAAIVPATPAAPTMSEEEAFAASKALQPSEEEVKDLDRRVARVRELGLSFVTTGWDLGHELNQINDRKLFLARRLASGAPKYRSFSVFVESELGVDASNVRKFMAVAGKYSREYVLAHGLSKMILVVQIPEGVRDAILADPAAMALPEKSLRQVTSLIRGGEEPKAAVAQVQAARSAAAAPVAEPPVEEEDTDDDGDQAPPSSPKPRAPAVPPASATPPAQAKGKAKEQESEDDDGEEKPERRELGELFTERKQTPVDVVTMPGRFQIKLYAMPSRSALGKKRRAFSLHEKPRGVFKFANGAELRVGVHMNATGGMYLVCDMSPPEG